MNTLYQFLGATTALAQRVVLFVLSAIAIVVGVGVSGIIFGNAWTADEKYTTICALLAAFVIFRWLSLVAPKWLVGIIGSLVVIYGLATPVILLLNQFEVYRTAMVTVKSEIGVLREEAAVEAEVKNLVTKNIRRAQTGRTSRDTVLYDVVAEKLTAKLPLAAGTKLFIDRDFMDGYYELFKTVSPRGCVKVNLMTPDGNNSGISGFVDVGAVEILGPEPVLGRDSRGGALPKRDSTEHLFDLKRGQATQEFVNWNNGYERQSVSFQVESGTIVYCEVGICGDPYQMLPKKGEYLQLPLNHPFKFKGGPEGAKIRVTVMRITEP